MSSRYVANFQDVLSNEFLVKYPGITFILCGTFLSTLRIFCPSTFYSPNFACEILRFDAADFPSASISSTPLLDPFIVGFLLANVNFKGGWGPNGIPIESVYKKV